MNHDFQQPVQSSRCSHGAPSPCSPFLLRPGGSAFAEAMADKTGRLRRLSAFTLIEVCIAVAVAGFALVTLAAVLGDAMSSGRRATDQTKATLIQQRLMRDLRSQPFGSSINVPSDGGSAHSVSLTTSNAYTWSFGPDLQYLGTGAQAGRYFLARMVAVPETSLPGLTRILLSVIWVDGQPRTTTNTLNTWVGQRQ